MLKDELETSYHSNKVRGELQKPKVKRPRSGTRLECGTDNVHQLRSRQLAARYLWRELLKRRYSIKLIFQNKGSKINCQQKKINCAKNESSRVGAGRRCLVPPKYMPENLHIRARLIKRRRRIITQVDKRHLQRLAGPAETGPGPIKFEPFYARADGWTHRGSGL